MNNYDKTIKEFLDVPNRFNNSGDGASQEDIDIFFDMVVNDYAEVLLDGKNDDNPPEVYEAFRRGLRKAAQLTGTKIDISKI